jgi:hypothetical protein
MKSKLRFDLNHLDDQLRLSSHKANYNEIKNKYPEFESIRLDLKNASKWDLEEIETFYRDQDHLPEEVDV